MQLQQKARNSPEFAPPEEAGAGRPRRGGKGLAYFLLPPALVALFIQIASGLVTLLILAPGLEFSGLHPDFLAMAFIQGGAALLASRYLGQEPWWQGMHLFFLPAMVSVQGFHIEPAWFFAAFVLLFLLYWSVFRSQIPLYLSSRKAWNAMADLLPVKSGVTLIDLGAGLGGMLDHLSKIRPDGRFSGMEIAPLPFVLARLRRMLGRGGYQISWGNFWSHKLADYDVVYAYLSPVPMNRLWQKACAEMRPGTCLISNTFDIPGVAAEKIVELDDFHRSRLYVYRIPAGLVRINP